NFGNDVLDLNNVGTRSLFFNTLSTLLSSNNYVKYYRSEYADFGFQRELSNGILWTSYLSFANRTQLYNISYNHIFTSKTRDFTSNNPLAPDGAPADDRSFLFPQNQALTFSTSVKFTFDQHYITRPTGKIYLPSAYPTLTVNYRKAIPNVFGTDADYDFASLDISQDKIRIGLMGYSSFKITGGTFITKKALYYMDYYHFLGNQGTTFDPTYVGSFHFLPFYTFSAGSAFLEAHYQHNFAGSLLNKVGFLRKLKLEEIIGANYLNERSNANYTEFYVGLQRLIFRVDYGISYAGDKKYLQGFRIFYGIR
ncbi:MAG: carboxypeptidase-like regulatory domain-containing protein, partial [Mucilaginibacter sp.]|nr:carboxypeptidase-like regulatory domain-containing protein [Mucilaginibacter sp.]